MAKDIKVKDDIEGRSEERERAAKAFGLQVVPNGTIDPTSTKGQVRVLQKDRAGDTIAAHQFSVRGNVQQTGGVGRNIAPFVGAPLVAQSVFDHRDLSKPVYMAEQGIVNGQAAGETKYYEAKWDPAKSQWEPKDRNAALTVGTGPGTIPAADKTALDNISTKAKDTRLLGVLILENANTGRFVIGQAGPTAARPLS